MKQKLIYFLFLSLCTTSLYSTKVEIAPMIGKNFAEKDSTLKNSTNAGIRVNTYVTDDAAIQVGYDRVSDTKYKDVVGGKLSKETDIDRYFVNGVYEIKQKDNNFVPYVFGGIGHEKVRTPQFDEKSQNFINAGGGVKYRVSDSLNFISEVKAIKKFKNKDVDVVGNIGLGLVLGAVAAESMAAMPDNKKVPGTVLPAIIEKAEILPIKPVVIVEKPIQSTFAHYIQMAAFYEGPCKKLLRGINQAGYDYILHKKMENGKEMTLVLVGPYGSWDEACENLPKLKKVNKAAFIKGLRR